ncbi:hypothetical protein BpHYR1_050300 [Brachionus plicatilis]|uniref:Uncharacterized protein n=1 Tax=Brachionus plicatilis TaxID=10195 RepID=A0A3M7R4P4_BRAPC|nr:hypothetical protein BpHYR1_050300 [Brachionus plicatilis]
MALFLFSDWMRYRSSKKSSEVKFLWSLSKWWSLGALKLAVEINDSMEQLDELPLSSSYE